MSSNVASASQTSNPMTPVIKDCSSSCHLLTSLSLKYPLKTNPSIAPDDSFQYQQENFSSQIQTDSLPLNKASSRKAIDNFEDPLDVEPLNINKSKIKEKDNTKFDSNNSEQIEDPW